MTDTTDDLAHLDARIDLIREQRDAMERIAAERAVASDRNLARWTSATDALHKATADLNATRSALTTAEAFRDSLQAEVDGLRVERDAQQADLVGLHCAAAERDTVRELHKSACAERNALRAEVAELRARPVLTVSMYRARIDSLPGRAEQVVALLGAVTLPAQDRAEELARAVNHGGGWPITTYAMSAALASLGAPATTPSKPADVFAGVSIDELVRISADAYVTAVDAPGRAGITAVLDALRVKLVTPVDPEEVARASQDAACEVTAGEVVSWLNWQALSDDLRASRVATMRATLAAAGIPVTPEAGK